MAERALVMVVTVKVYVGEDDRFETEAEPDGLPALFSVDGGRELADTAVAAVDEWLDDNFSE